MLSTETVRVSEFEFVTVCVTVWSRIEPLALVSVSVSVRVLPETTIWSTVVRSFTPSPVELVVVVLVRPLALTEVVVASISVPLRVRFEIATDVLPSALVASTSCWSV